MGNADGSGRVRVRVRVKRVGIRVRELGLRSGLEGQSSRRVRFSARVRKL